MNIEFLKDYEESEREQIERICRKILEGNFSFAKDRYPPDDRFVKLNRPVEHFWAQIPFCGSLIISLYPFEPHRFEEALFKLSDIPKIIDFIKETGKLQVGLPVLNLRAYRGLDFLDPFFQELKPPVLIGAPLELYGTPKEIQEARETFYALASVKILKRFRTDDQIRNFLSTYGAFYAFLKLGRFQIVEEIENKMIDEPMEALWLIYISKLFICDPCGNLRFDVQNLSLADIKGSEVLPLVYRPKVVTFSCEIGKYLLKKLIHAPYGLDACKELISHYDAYDLQKVLKSLNEAILNNNPDMVITSSEELSEILDNVWGIRQFLQELKV